MKAETLGATLGYVEPEAAAQPTLEEVVAETVGEI